MEDEGIDPEIREIFVEEARDVLETLNEYCPRWLDNLEDEAALSEVRRAYHTLKGSGRMAGAVVLGEFAWSIENLLDKIIENKVEVQPVISQLVGEFLTVLPEMITGFEQSSILWDQQRANTLEVAAKDLAEGKTVEQSSLVVSEATDGGEFIEIFRAEARNYLDAIKDFVAGEKAKAPFFEPPTPELQSTLHTLKGCANIAGVEMLSELVTPIERFMLEMLNFQVALDESIVALLEEATDYSYLILDKLTPSKQMAMKGLPAFLTRLKEVKEKTLQQVTSDDSKASHKVDPSFINLLMTEGMQQTLDVDRILAAWHADAAFEIGTINKLVEELGDLAKGAEKAGFSAITELCKALVPAYERLISFKLPLAEGAKNQLLSAHEALLALVDAVAATQEVVLSDNVVLDNLTVLAQQVWAEESTEKDSGLWSAELPEGADPEIVALFLGEADELLEIIEQSFDGWRESPKDASFATELKRALHTFKGGSRMAGLAELGDTSHELETLVIDNEKAISEGDSQVLKKILADYDRLVTGIDQIRAVFEKAPGQGQDTDITDGSQQQVQEPEMDAGEPESVDPEQQWASAEVLPFTGTYKGLDLPADTLAGSEQQSMVRETIKVAAPALELLVNLAGESSISHSQVEQHINEFMFSLDEMEATVRRMHDQIRRLGIETDAQITFRQEQIELSETGDFDPLEMDRYSQLQQLARSLIESASDIQDLRNTLVDKSRDAESLLLQQSRINSELQEGLMRTRMVPFSRLVPRLRRIVRQVANDLGKDVTLKLDSIDGELDRTIMERIVPALEHMIRNAIDHGIEDQHTRGQLGKPLEGTLSLSFSREGADVLIKLADDGQGLNLDAIRAKALSRGLLQEDTVTSNHELSQYIFMPGFTTAKTVTQVSGRGVGMDVVNNEVRQLGGLVTLNSQPGAGTEFTVRLPFTVSVNRALMIEAGEDSYALPLSSINGITRIGVDELLHLYKNPDKMFEYGGDSYEVRYLGSLLADDLQPTLDTAIERQLPLVLIRGDDKSYAVQVDGLIGSREIVVKSIGAQFSRVPGLSGATVMGDGRVVVILDLHALLRIQLEAPVFDPVALETVKSQEDSVVTVMVVDDSVTVRKVTGRFLEREGFRVITAQDGVEAMRTLQDNTPDVMLLDIEMPRMDGFEVASLVRSTLRLKNLPIIMITSRTGDKHRERALSMGVNRYMGKPFQEEELMRNINALLDESSVARRQPEQQGIHGGKA